MEKKKWFIEREELRFRGLYKINEDRIWGKINLKEWVKVKMWRDKEMRKKKRERRLNN